LVYHYGTGKAAKYLQKKREKDICYYKRLFLIYTFMLFSLYSFDTCLKPEYEEDESGVLVKEV